MGDRGSEFCEDDGGNVFTWKRCEIPKCPNLVCVGRSKRFCYPHSGSGMKLSEMLADAVKEVKVSS